MTFTTTATCALCQHAFQARTSYGLCERCFSKDTLREFDRIQSACLKAEKRGLPVGLRLVEWLSVLSDHTLRCAYCGVEWFHEIHMVRREYGLVYGNVVPACRSCIQHAKHTFQAAEERVLMYLDTSCDEEEGEPIEEDGLEPLVETQVCSFGDIFPGFKEWYLEHYDEHGKLMKDDLPESWKLPPHMRGGQA